MPLICLEFVLIVEHLQRLVRIEQSKRHSLYQPPKSGPFPGAVTTTTKPCKNVSGRGMGADMIEGTKGQSLSSVSFFGT